MHCQSRIRAGLTVIEVVVFVVIVGVIAAVAVPKFRSTKGDADSAALKGDLRNLSSAQESFFRDHQRYSTSMDSLQTSASRGIVLTIREASAAGWSATAHHPATWPHTCAVFFGRAAPLRPATSRDTIACD